MSSASFTVSVDRPLDEVRAYVADVRHVPEWLSLVSHVDLVEGEPGAPGSRFVVRAERSTLDSEMDYRTDAVEPGLVRFAVDHPTLSGTDAYALREVPGGTEVTYTTDVAAKGLFKLTAPFIALALKAVTGGAKDDFKAAVESS